VCIVDYLYRSGNYNKAYMSNKAARHIRRGIEKAHQRIIQRGIWAGWVLFWLFGLIIIGVVLKMKMPYLTGNHFESATSANARWGNE